jgi:hypothetical protein
MNISKIRVLIWLSSFAALAVSFWHFYLGDPGQRMTGTSSVQGVASGSSSVDEYQTPFGYRFSYPPGFRLASDYMSLLNGSDGGDLIVLTTVTKDDEQSYVDEVTKRALQQNVTITASLAETDFFPDQTVSITLDSTSFANIERTVYQAANPEYQQVYEQTARRPYPETISNVEPLTTAQGDQGIIAEWEDNYPASGKTPLSVQADLPYEPRSVSLAVDYIPSLDIVYAVSGTSTIPQAESVIRELAATIEFD